MLKGFFIFSTQKIINEKILYPCFCNDFYAVVFTE